MSSEEKTNKEIQYFNVKNISLRLVHIGSVSILPDKVIAVVDDPLGVNRRDVETSDYLEETDEEVSDKLETEIEEKPVVAKKPKAVPAKSTASGAGWTAPKKA